MDLPHRSRKRRQRGVTRLRPLQRGVRASALRVRRAEDARGRRLRALLVRAGGGGLRASAARVPGAQMRVRRQQVHWS